MELEIVAAAGLVIGFVASRFVQAEQHDARGIIVLVCVTAALAVGRLGQTADVGGPLAWLAAVIATIAVARVAVDRARRRAGRAASPGSQHNPRHGGHMMAR
jgi:hypothetical protein